jgi:hypothetical protein
MIARGGAWLLTVLAREGAWLLTVLAREDQSSTHHINKTTRRWVC